MPAWIFQANPDRFDIDGYLRTEPRTGRWLARQRADEMQVGDTVYLWRAIGNGDPKLSGVVAAAEIIAQPTVQWDAPSALPFWRSLEHFEQSRVDLRFTRIALGDRIRRGWLAADPVLGNAAILRLRTGTNFPLHADEAARLAAIWSRAGQDWDYAEAVAGMWAYWKTKGGSVSKLPGSIVADVALRTGRVVGGVYNKTMNFRSLDPDDPRDGLPATSSQDRRVWARFYDAHTGVIDGTALDQEYQRLWGTVAPSIPAADLDAEKRAKSLRRLPLAELLARYAARSTLKPPKPRSQIATIRTFERDPLVVAIALARSGSACEVPACTHPLFLDADGRPFLEVHHITPLAEGGSDAIENVACVCPSHHREAHHGANASDIESALRAVRG